MFARFFNALGRPLLRFVQYLGEIVMLAGDTFTFSRKLALQIVSLLSTTFLLKNLTFLLMYFAVLWAIVRARTHRRVAKLIERWQVDPDLDPVRGQPAARGGGRRLEASSRRMIRWPVAP